MRAVLRVRSHQRWLAVVKLNREHVLVSDRLKMEFTEHVKTILGAPLYLLFFSKTLKTEQISTVEIGYQCENINRRMR